MLVGEVIIKSSSPMVASVMKDGKAKVMLLFTASKYVP